MWKKLCTLLLLCLLLLLPAAQALEGVDVSVYQGKIDFAAVKESGIQVMYIRSSYGWRGVDRWFVQNWTEARDAGIPFGLYHYMNATDPAGARREAEHFAQLIAEVDYQCRPVLDFEGHRELSAEEATAAVLAFLERVEELTGHRPMIYADHSTASTQLGAAVAEYPLWLAQWGVTKPNLGGTHWTQWAGWQYSNQGQVSGISGRVDRDRFTQAVFLEEKETTFPYTVRRGDTLWRLSRRFGTTVEKLVELNGISNPNLIYVNQILQIPGEGSAEKTYTVQRGDTLWGISRMYGVTVNQIAALNHIPNPDLIYPGQVFRIP